MATQQRRNRREASMKVKHDEALREASTLRTDLQQAKDRIDQLGARLLVLEPIAAEHEECASAMEHLRGQVDELQTECDRLGSDFDELKGLLDETMKAESEAVTELVVAQGDLVKAEAAAKTNELKKVRRRLQESSKLLEQRNTTISKLRRASAEF